MSEEFEYKEEYQYLSNIMLCVTDACNLACRYCFVQQHPNFMSLQTAKDAIDWTWSNYQKKQKLKKNVKDLKCSVNFFGGEPTLLFDEVLKPLIEYSKEKKYDIRYGITTNGTLLNEERIKFFYENKVGLLLSIDGFKPTQDYNRPCQNGESSFDKIIKNIPILLKYYPELTFRSTIYEDTVEHCFENYLFAEKAGFKSYFCVPDVLTCKWSKEKLQILEEQMHKIFEYRFLQYSNKIKPMFFSREDGLFFNIKNIFLNKNIENNFDPLVRCGLGTALGAIGYDGNIYGCQEWASAEEVNIFYIGNIYKNGIDKEKHSKILKMYFDVLNNKTFNINCNNKNCFKYDVCMKTDNFKLYCPSQCYHLYSNINYKDEISCYYEEILFKECLTIFQALTESNNEFFIDKINHL